MDNTIIMTVKDGQVQFDNLPEGWGVLIKNYTNEIAEDAFITAEQQEAEQLYQDEAGWYYSSYFAELSAERYAGDENQLELPIEAR